jgi:hypothetical protein
MVLMRSQRNVLTGIDKFEKLSQNCQQPENRLAGILCRRLEAQYSAMAMPF